jgi:arylformamidase
MELLDITVPVREGMPIYEGDPSVHLIAHQSMSAGDLADVSRLDFGVHTGTHVDAPRHFIAGAGGVETLPLDALLGPAWVADATATTGDLDAAALDALAIPRGTERVLFKTGNGHLWALARFSPDFVGLLPEAAEWLVSRGIRLVGIDYLSIAPSASPASTHRVLLKAGVVILEGLDLRGVEPGKYELCCLPMLLAGSDGAPARAVLVR